MVTRTIQLIFLTVLSTVIPASALSYSDSTGTIVAQAADYTIRLIETPGTTVKTASATFTVKASPAACNAVILDFKNYPQFMPNICRAEFVAQRSGAPLWRFGFKVMLWTIHYTDIFYCSQPDSQSYAIRWDFVEGDIKKTTGSWLIQRDPTDSLQSIIYYTVYIDTGMPFPGPIRDQLLTKSIPKMIEGIRSRVSDR